MNRSTLTRLAVALAIATLAASGAAQAGPHHQHGDQAYLGISLARVENIDGAERNGLYIAGVSEGSGAAEAGLKAHDRILSVDGRRVDTHKDVQQALSGLKAGDSVEVTVLRDGDERSFDVVLGERPSSIHMKLAGGPHFVMETRDGKRPMLGIHAMSLNDQLARYFDVEGGAMVTEVSEDGPAWKAGIRAGDVITGWNGSAIKDMQAIHSRLDKSKAGEVVDLEVIRRGSVERFSVALAEGSLERTQEFLIQIGDDEGVEVHGHDGKSMKWIQKDDDQE